jgi:hypothetical protein
MYFINIWPEHMAMQCTSQSQTDVINTLSKLLHQDSIRFQSEHWALMSKFQHLIVVLLILNTSAWSTLMEFKPLGTFAGSLYLISWRKSNITHYPRFHWLFLPVICVIQCYCWLPLIWTNLSLFHVFCIFSPISNFSLHSNHSHTKVPHKKCN